MVIKHFQPNNIYNNKYNLGLYSHSLLLVQSLCWQPPVFFSSFCFFTSYYFNDQFGSRFSSPLSSFTLIATPPRNTSKTCCNFLVLSIWNIQVLKLYRAEHDEENNLRNVSSKNCFHIWWTQINCTELITIQESNTLSQIFPLHKWCSVNFPLLHCSDCPACSNE